MLLQPAARLARVVQRLVPPGGADGRVRIADDAVQQPLTAQDAGLRALLNLQAGPVLITRTSVLGEQPIVGARLDLHECRRSMPYRRRDLCRIRSVFRIALAGKELRGGSPQNQ